jgi:tRNA (cytidine/uridine-2'-O-)-methyltransferase
MAFSSAASRPGSLRSEEAQVSGVGLHVVLLEPEIHWNTGNAGRTCLAVGARLHLVEPLGFSLDERALRRAGLDYWPQVAPRLWPSWAALEAALPELGEPWFFSTEGVRSHWQVGYTRPAVLVFGRESTGLPAALRERYRERLVRIPIDGARVRALNLSTAVGVAAYEVLRQWAGINSPGSVP